LCLPSRLTAHFFLSLITQSLFAFKSQLKGRRHEKIAHDLANVFFINNN